MSDQYTPPSPKPYVAATGPYRADVRVEVAPPAAPSAAFNAPRETGFGSGILVAAVFVVVAIIAAAIFSNRDAIGASDAAPNVTIENTVAPAESAAPADPVPAPAPAAEPAPEPAPAPEVVDPVVPPAEAATPEPAAPANP